MSKTGADPFDVQIVGGTGVTCTANPCTYNWTGIPDQQCTACAIKVYKTTEPGLTTGTAGLSSAFHLKGNTLKCCDQRSTYNIGRPRPSPGRPRPIHGAPTSRLKKYSKDGILWTNLTCSNFTPAGSVGPASVFGTCSWAIPDEDLIATTDRIGSRSSEMRPPRLPIHRFLPSKAR